MTLSIAFYSLELSHRGLPCNTNQVIWTYTLFLSCYVQFFLIHCCIAMYFLIIWTFREIKSFLCPQFHKYLDIGKQFFCIWKISSILSIKKSVSSCNSVFIQFGWAVKSFFVLYVQTRVTAHLYSH